MIRSSRTRLGVGTVLLLVLSFLITLNSVRSGAQVTVVPATPAAWARGAERQVGGIRIVPIRGEAYMLAGAEGNSAAHIGRDGVVVVDTMSAAAAPNLLEAIRTLTMRPVVQIINTGMDRAGGNEVIRNAGRASITMEAALGLLPPGVAPGTTTSGAPILAFDEVLNRMTADGSGIPQGVWPTSTYFVERKDVFVNGEPIHLYHQPAATTDGDSVVLFRRTDFVVAGDLFTPNQYPRVDLERGGSLNGVIAGLNRVIDLTVPESKQDGGTMVVPGSGRLGDEADVAEYRDMVTIVRDRIDGMVRRGLTLEQVKAARPTRDYDTVYSKPAYSGEAFVDVAYKSLSASARPAR